MRKLLLVAAVVVGSVTLLCLGTIFAGFAIDEAARNEYPPPDWVQMP